jgi:hypothetical protein
MMRLVLGHHPRRRIMTSLLNSKFDIDTAASIVGNPQT